MSNLYHRNLWPKLLRFVRRKYPVYVSINNDRKDLKKFPTAITIADAPNYLRRFRKYVKTGDESLLKTYKYNPKGRHTICILHNKHEHLYCLACVLIHEFGHCLLYLKYSSEELKKIPLKRLEKMAWSIGKKNIPKHLLPPEYIFEYIKSASLHSYGIL